MSDFNWDIFPPFWKLKVEMVWLSFYVSFLYMSERVTLTSARPSFQHVTSTQESLLFSPKIRHFQISLLHVTSTRHLGTSLWHVTLTRHFDTSLRHVTSKSDLDTHFDTHFDTLLFWVFCVEVTCEVDVRNWRCWSDVWECWIFVEVPALSWSDVWKWRISGAENEWPLCGMDVLKWRVCGIEGYSARNFVK